MKVVNKIRVMCHLYIWLSFIFIYLTVPSITCSVDLVPSSAAQSYLTFMTPWTAAWQASLSITNSQSLLKLMFIKLVMPSHHLILCRPLFRAAFNTFQHRVYSNESVLHIRWSKDWSLSFSISPSNEHSGLISFRMDWLDLLAV